MTVNERTYTISVDTGGTFTDLVVADQASVVGLYKAATTPENLITGIIEALENAAEAQSTDVTGLLGRTSVFIYSTTYSTNALLEGHTARTAFLTTRGHRDILLYREGGKDQIHNWALPFPKPYVPRRLTFEVTERVLTDGSVAVPLDEDEVRRTLQRLGELGVDAVAVSLMWAQSNPVHEERVGALIEEVLPGVEYSLGHRVNRITREHRRSTATAIDASLKPLMRHHLLDIESRLRQLGFRGEPLMVTHVSGGVLRLDQIVERPLHTIDSGPALAPIAGIQFDRAEPDSTVPDVLVVDTGGTSFDVSLILNERVAYTREKWVGRQWYGYMTGLPAVDTRSIGAGGGSIASVDAGGLLHVGPESAGSVPGPACYGRGGTDPTVTDASLVLGYIDPDNFLGGRMRLDAEAARAAIERGVAKPLGLSVEASAEAVLVVASEEMRGLINDITIAQGRDVRECLLVAGGGAAGLNILRIAREAGVRRVVIPKLAAGLSALGGVYSDITAIFSRGRYTVTSQFDYPGVNTALEEISADIDDFLAGQAHPGQRTRSFQCEARYDQQLWEIEVDLGGKTRFGGPEDVEALQRQFDANHLDLFAVNQPGAPLEITTWRGEARLVRDKPMLTRADAPATVAGVAAAPSHRRTAYFDGTAVETAIYRSEDLAPGEKVTGPAVIEEPTTSVVLIPGTSAIVRPSHYLVEVDPA